MAFFLLMWLLGSTTEGDKKGIADFFNAPLKVALIGGSGAGDSSHVVRGGGQDLSRTTGQVKDGDVPAKRKILNLQVARGRAEAGRGRRASRRSRRRSRTRSSASPKLAAMKSQIRLDMTRDGLRIQIVDEQNRPMFDNGSAVVEAVHERAAAARSATSCRTCRTASRSRATPTPSRSAAASAATATGSSRPTAPTPRGARSSPAACRRTASCSSRAWRRATCSSRPSRRNPMNRRISIIVMNRDAEDRLLKLLPNQGEADAGEAAAAAGAAQPR